MPKGKMNKAALNQQRRKNIGENQNRIAEKMPNWPFQFVSGVCQSPLLLMMLLLAGFHQTQAAPPGRQSNSAQANLAGLDDGAGVSVDTVQLGNHTAISSAAPVSHFGSIQQQPSTDLQQLIQQAKIVCPEHYRNALPDWIAIIDRQIERIRSALPKSMNRDRLRKVLSDPSFTIQVVPVNDPDLSYGGKLSCEGQYSPKTNTIRIKLNADFEESHLTKLLANEMHHASIRAVNTDDGKQELAHPEALFPFFNRKAQKVDDLLLAKLKAAIKSAEKRINDLQSLLNKVEQGVKLKKSEKLKWEEYAQVFSNYKPFTRLEEVSLDLVPHLLRDESFNIEKVILDSSSAMIFFEFGPNKTLTDKIKIFIREYDIVLHGIYEGGYQEFDKETKLMELLSSIEEFPPEIKKFFFKDMCDYLSEYTKTPDYCMRPS